MSANGFLLLGNVQIKRNVITSDLISKEPADVCNYIKNQPDHNTNRENPYNNHRDISGIIGFLQFPDIGPVTAQNDFTP